MDLYYIQEIDPRRYNSAEFTYFIVTLDKLLATIFKNYHNANKCCGSEHELFAYLCDDLPAKYKGRYISYLDQCYQNHKPLNANPANALEISKKLAEQEEERLKDYLLKSR